MRILCKFLGHDFRPVLQQEGMNTTSDPGRLHIGSFFRDLKCSRCPENKPAEQAIKGVDYFTNITHPIQEYHRYCDYGHEWRSKKPFDECPICAEEKENVNDSDELCSCEHD